MRYIILALCLLSAGCVDRGKCLAGYVQHHHDNAYTECIGNRCTFYEADDYDTLVCTKWEFPNGRVEKDDKK